MKHNPGGRRRSLLAGALVVTLLLATGCARIAAPKGWASPVRDGDIVIVQTDAGEITALRLSDDTSEPIWVYPGDTDDVDLTAVYATPIIEGGTVYIAAYSGTVVALNIDGENKGRPVPAWGGTIDLGARIVATPVLRDGRLYVATAEGTIVSIEATTGVVTTLIETGDRIWGRPEVDASRLYVAALGTQLRAIDRSTGTIQWGRDVGAVAGDLLIDGDLLFVGTLNRRLHALDITAAGGGGWSADGDAGFWARPLVAGDTVYAATTAGSVYAFDRNGGRELWRFHRDSTEIRAAPVLVDGVLIVASRDGHLYGINPANGVERWTQKVDGERFLANPLVLESGVVIYVDDSGGLWRVTSAGDVRQLFDQS